MPTEPPRAFVLGGRLPRRIGRTEWRGATAVAIVAFVAFLPVRGLYRATGASMEEGFMLVFPRLVNRGWVPNDDFLHLYGPTSLDVLALWYRIFGDSLESQRTFGLLQHLAIVFALYALARVGGRRVAVGAGVVAALLIMTPIGLSALAWHGGLALALWSTVFAIRGRATRRRIDWIVSGLLAGLALGYRPDLVLAVGLCLGVATWRRRTDLGRLAVGATVGLTPMWIHLVRAGLVDSVNGMVIDPVVRLRPGRELPTPPSWGRIDGALQAVAEGVPPWWRLPAPGASQQLFLWFWAVVVIALGLAWWSVREWRRRQAAPGTAADALMIGSLFGLGIVSQALQRPDSTHLAWVAVVSWPLLAVAIATVVRSRLRWRSGRSVLIGVGAVAALMLVVCPFFTYRTYLLHTRVSVGDLPVPFEVTRGGRHFWFGDVHVARALNSMIPVLEARTEPGDRLFVGPADLSRTIYSDVSIYYLFPELEPATYYIEMDPGLADRQGSGLAEDVAGADVLVLTNIWTGWNEPNASDRHRSQAPNQAVADGFCLVDRFEDNLVLLFERCAGGGGVSPADITGTYPLPADG